MGGGEREREKFEPVAKRLEKEEKGGEEEEKEEVEWVEREEEGEKGGGEEGPIQELMASSIFCFEYRSTNLISLLKMITMMNIN